MRNNKYEELIAEALAADGIEFLREYRFDKPETDRAIRKFRFDFAIPQYKIAIEFEGGVFIQGRHNSAIGFINDCDKYNLAACQGWKVLRYTSNHLRNGGQYMITRTVRELIMRNEKERG